MHLFFFDFVYHCLHFKDHCVRSIILKAYRWIVCYIATSFFPYSSWIWLWVVFVCLFLVFVDSLMDMKYELCVVNCYAMNKKLTVDCFCCDRKYDTVIIYWPFPFILNLFEMSEHNYMKLPPIVELIHILWAILLIYWLFVLFWLAHYLWRYSCCISQAQLIHNIHLVIVK